MISAVLLMLLTVVICCKASQVAFVRHVHSSQEYGDYQTILVQPGMIGEAYTTWKADFTKHVQVTVTCESTRFELKVNPNEVQRMSNDYYGIMASTVQKNTIRITLEVNTPVNDEFSCIVGLVHYDDDTTQLDVMTMYYRAYHLEIASILTSETEVMCNARSSHMLHMSYEWYYQSPTQGSKHLNSHKKTNSEQWKDGRYYIYNFKGMTVSHQGCGSYTCVVSDRVSSVLSTKVIPCEQPLVDNDAKSEL
ncbi:hypothetical protein nvc1_047 [Namao virus]|nr:hypothetical protein nvc1_047 [Namao virus]